MQKKQIFQLVLLAVGAVLAAVIGFWLVPVSNYVKARTAPLDETILEAESSTREVVTISDTELSQLISGELTLDALADLPGVITVEPGGSTAGAAQSGGAANGSPADETSASAIAESEASSDAASREAQADAETPAQSSAVSGSTGTSGNASLSEAAYEGEVKALVQQLYAVKGRAEGGLNACIASAKAEYKSLPPEQQTRSRKIAICMSKAGQLSALQASCDSEVNRIVSQMRSVLKANGQSTRPGRPGHEQLQEPEERPAGGSDEPALRLSRFLITLWRNQRGTTHIFAARCGKRRFPALAGRCAPDAADHPNHFGSGRPGNHLYGCLPGADRTEQRRPGSALLR